MPKYRVVETATRSCVVEADSADEAIRRAEELDNEWVYSTTWSETAKARRMRGSV